MAKQKVALECLSYHATATAEDTNKLVQDIIPSAEFYNLYRWFYLFIYFNENWTILLYKIKKLIIIIDD